MKITTPQRPSTVGYARDFLPPDVENADSLANGGSSLAAVDTGPTIASAASDPTGSSKDGRPRVDSKLSGQQGLSSLPKGIGA